MSGRIAAIVLIGMMLGVGGAAAQETTGPGFVEVTYIPAGAAFFTSKGDAPSFGNYGFGTAATFNINRYVGIEAELGSMIATTSDLQFGDLDPHKKAPNMLSYTGNAVVSLWTGHAVVPYATGGVGGLTMFERPSVGVFDDETFLTGNVGGGVSGMRGTIASAAIAVAGGDRFENALSRAAIRSDHPHASACFIGN